MSESIATGGLMDREISGIRKEQAIFEKEMAESKNKFSEYLKEHKEEIKRLECETLNDSSIPADRMNGKVGISNSVGKKSFFEKLSEIFR